MTAGDLVNEKEISEILGITVGTLRQMRANPALNGPPFFKLGHAVRYSKIGVQKWLEGQKVDSNSLAKRVRRA